MEIKSGNNGRENELVEIDIDSQHQDFEIKAKH